MITLTRRIAIAAMMLVLTVGAAVAQPGDGDGRGRGDRGPGDGGHGRLNQGQDMLLRRCLGTLELTAEQRDQIAAIQARVANAEQTMRAEIEALNKRLRNARENGDREAAATIMEEIRSKNEALHAMHEAAHAAILRLLTPEQLAALRACMGPRGDGDKGRKREPNDCFSQLELTQDQMDAMKALRDAFATEHRASMEAVRALHKQLREARRADASDEEIAALRQQIEAAMETIRAAQEQLRQDILNVLTDEQKQALEDCREEKDGDNGRGRGGRRGQANVGESAPALK